MPGSVERTFAVALGHHQAGRLSQAESGYREILQVEPGHADAWHLLGVLALQAGQFEHALELIQRAIKLRPDGGVYRSNLGQVLERLGRVDAAFEEYRRAIAVDPACFEACNNLGRLLQKRDEFAAAEAHFVRAIELNRDYAEPYTNLGNLLKDRGELDPAIALYRRGISLRPDSSMMHSNLLLSLHYHVDYSPADLAREHKAWAERHVAPLAGERQTHANDRDENRRLRVGYVSPDFREHAIARFMLPLLANHDKTQVEVFAYADSGQPDAVTNQIRAHCDHWRETSQLTDAALAAAIRKDGIDILVDLAAHSGHNRLLVFARKPAPVQVSYLAYCSTTGVDAIDYRLTDRYLDPDPDQDRHYVERSLRLPHCYWCYAPPELPQDQLPSTARREGPPSFICLNNFAKVTDTTLRLWTELLQRVPEAQLIVYARGESHQQRLLRVLSASGIAEARVRFVGWQPLREYLATYQHADVALDPFPYGGGTTSCDALWMAVPVVTLGGQTAVSRAGTTLLANLGLSELIAEDEAAYVEIAAGLLRDTDRLALLRQELRPRLEASPIMNAASFARDIESIYRQTWTTWCRDSTTARSQSDR